VSERLTPSRAPGRRSLTGAVRIPAYRFLTVAVLMGADATDRQIDELVYALSVWTA